MTAKITVYGSRITVPRFMAGETSVEQLLIAEQLRKIADSIQNGEISGKRYSDNGKLVFNFLAAE